MLITPLFGRADFRNPPVATLAIILVNVLIFFFFQSSDRRIYEEAREYYRSSGLAALEIAAYEQYREYGAVVNLSGNQTMNPPVHEEKTFLMHDMRKDGVFMDRLDKGLVITPEMEVYSFWKHGRDHLDGLVSSTTVMKYGFRPAAWDLEHTVSYMFLHRGLAHLLGNVIFLWLVGYLLELVWGRALYTGLYVLGGMCAAALFGLACPAGAVPLVGASGAVAALMGAYAVLYGRRKIKVLYPVGFSFNHTMVPGSVILALWGGSEIFQLCLGTETQAAYLAHLGGFGIGVAMGLARRLIPDVRQEDPPGQEPGTGNKVALLLDKALRRAEKLDTKGARYLLGEVLKLDSHNRTALTRKYHLDKVDADCDDLHLSAGRLLELLVDDRQAHLEALAVYREYIRTASRPRLPLALLFSLSSYFAATGHLEEAEKIMGFLLKKRPDLPMMPRGLLHLARACLKDSLESKARSYLQVICMRYPLSGETTVAQRILDDLDGETRQQTEP